MSATTYKRYCDTEKRIRTLIHLFPDSGIRYTPDFLWVRMQRDPDGHYPQPDAFEIGITPEWVRHHAPVKLVESKHSPTPVPTLNLVYKFRVPYVSPEDTEPIFSFSYMGRDFSLDSIPEVLPDIYSPISGFLYYLPRLDDIKIFFASLSHRESSPWPNPFTYPLFKIYQDAYPPQICLTEWAMLMDAAAYQTYCGHCCERSQITPLTKFFP